MDLAPLHGALDDLEKAVASVAEKIGTAVTDDVTQQDVDALVSRVGAQVERLAGLQAPATATASNPAAEAPAPQPWKPS